MKILGPMEKNLKILGLLKIHFGGRRPLKAKCTGSMKVNMWP